MMMEYGLLKFTELTESFALRNTTFPLELYQILFYSAMYLPVFESIRTFIHLSNLCESIATW
jgi:hypothetical protein